LQKNPIIRILSNKMTELIIGHFTVKAINISKKEVMDYADSRI